MKGTVAIVREQGIDFTVLLVKRGVINSPNREAARNSAPSNFPRPVILAEQQSNGRVNYHGRTDIVKFLSNYQFSQLPWRDYTA